MASNKGKKKKAEVHLKKAKMSCHLVEEDTKGNHTRSFLLRYTGSGQNYTGGCIKKASALRFCTQEFKAKLQVLPLKSVHATMARG